jgi:FkbM family methyltransferase
MNIKDALNIRLIQLLRLIPIYSPSERGLWRVENVINKLASALEEDHTLRIASRDRRLFDVRLRDKTYSMGLLGRAVYEPIETTIAAGRVKRGSVAIDIGANFGWYTTLFSRLVGPQGVIHAFEPVPTMFETLQINCRLNGCSNVTLNNCALGDTTGTTVVHDFVDEPSGHASLFSRSNRRSTASPCNIRTLDEYMGRVGQPCHFIKCDVEGAEVSVLAGAADTIKEYLPIILIEINDSCLSHAGHTPLDVVAMLIKYGYRIYQIGTFSTDLTEIKEPITRHNLPDYANVLCVPHRSSSN